MKKKNVKKAREQTRVVKRSPRTATVPRAGVTAPHSVEHADTGNKSPRKKLSRTATVPRAGVTSSSFAGGVTEAERLRFRRIAEEISSAPFKGKGDRHSEGIGTLGEKRMHAILKTYLTEDRSCHEVRIASPSGKRSAGYVADVRIGEELYEVQTGGFYPLRPKLACYLEHTDCHVTVVHPIAGEKQLSWIDPDTGEITPPRRSPKRGSVSDVARELYWLSPFIPTGRVSLRLLFLRISEYRMKDGWGRGGKRGSTRYERIPTELLGDLTLRTASDYAACFLPDADRLPAPFTAAEYARASGIRGKATYAMLRLFLSLGLLCENGKRGRSMTYCRCDPKTPVPGDQPKDPAL